MPRALLIAGTHSGVGKTTVSAALMAAYRRRGLRTQGFKVGPDFIDPGYHAAATGRTSRNLDTWLMDRPTVIEVFRRASLDCDIAIVEGVMGLFDGASGADLTGSTAELAKWLGIPVVLVIDAGAMAGSAAAVIHGFETFDSELSIVATIANNVAGEAHFQYIKEAVEARHCRSRLIGWLRRDPSISVPERHLGLRMPEESDCGNWVETLADWIESGVNLDELFELASISDSSSGSTHSAERTQRVSSAPIRIGVARDRAFCFYYQDNLDLLESYGAELVFWSPLSEPVPTGLNALYLGGGYPEIYASSLSANRLARESVRRFVETGGSVYAECGGLMYLTECIVGTSGDEFPMAGVFPVKCRMQDRLAAIGYVSVEGTGVHPMLPRSERARGHQFRYSTIDPMPDWISRAYVSEHAFKSSNPGPEGYIINACLASYVHLHFLSNPSIVRYWLQSCASGITTRS